MERAVAVPANQKKGRPRGESLFPPRVVQSSVRSSAKKSGTDPKGQSPIFLKLERVMGIEPTFLAWEATFLPLEDTRVPRILPKLGCCGWWVPLRYTHPTPDCPQVR